MKQWKVGDVVRLLTGGPNMTVNGFYHEQEGVEGVFVHCLWFSGTELKEGRFRPDTLEAVPETDKPATSPP